MNQPAFSADGSIDQQVTVMSIIAGVLTMTSAAICVGVAVVVNPFQNPPSGTLISYIMVGVSVLDLVIIEFIRRNFRIKQSQLPSGMSTEQQYAAEYQTKMIIKFAVIQGGVFMNAIAVFLEGNLFNLIIAFGLIVVMAMLFPTKSRVEDYIRTQTELQDFNNEQS